jgi:hypothetical protein
MDYINDPEWDKASRDESPSEDYGWQDPPHFDYRPVYFDDHTSRQKPPGPQYQHNPGCLASLFGFALIDRMMFPSDEEGFDDFLDDLFF